VSRVLRLVRSAPFAFGACALAFLVQLSPLFFLGRPVGVADIAATYVPWATPGAPPPANPLLDDAATALAPWLATWKEHPGELLAIPGAACGAIGPLAGVFGFLSPFVLLSFGLLPREFAFSGLIGLDLLAGFLAFYLWRRRRGDADLPAALGAAVWAWAPARAVLRTWPFCGVPVLFPLLLLAVDMELDPDPPSRARRSLAWAGLAGGLVLCGHPSFGMMGVWLAAAWAAARIFAARDRTPLSRRLAGFAPAAVGVALSLLALVPVLALGRSFLEAGEWRQLRAPLASLPPVPWRVLFLLFDPSFYGSPAEGNWRSLGWSGPDNLVEVQLYMGLAALLLVPLGLVSARRREALFFGTAGIAVLLAVVAGGPFAAAARLLPGIGLIVLSRLRLVALFSAAVLVSLGAAALSRHRIGRARFVLPGLLLFTTLDLSLADTRFDPFPAAPDAPLPVTPAFAKLREIAPGNGKRFLGFGTALVPNLGMEAGLEDLRAHLLFSGGYRRLLARLDPNVYGRRGTYLTFEADTFRPDEETLDLLGVAALIAPNRTREPGGDFERAYEGEDGDVYSRRWAAPARLLLPRGGDAAGAGRVLSFEANRLSWKLEVESIGDSVLVLGRQRLPLVDRVRVDGRDVAAGTDPRAEGLLAMNVPPGRHVVTIDAALPPRLLVPSLIGIFGSLVLLVLAFRRTVPARLVAE
jgi:hypothetical protein